MAKEFELKAILKAVDKMTPTLKAIQQTSRATRKHLLDVGNAASGLASKVGLPLGLLSSVAAGFTLVGVKHQVEAFTESAEGLVNTAIRMGTTAEQLQRIKFVAGQSGVEVESLQSSIGKLNKNLGLAAAGKNKDLSGLLAHLKISMRDSNGQLRSGLDLLPQLSDAFVRNENAVVRARIGNTLFGKGYQDLMPVLAEGSAKLKETTAIYQSLNAGMSSTELEKAKSLGDQFKILGFAGESLRNTVMLQLMPVITPLVTQLQDWVIANKTLIATKLTQFVKDTITAIKGFDWKGFVESVKSLWNNFQTLVTWIGGARNALILFAIVANAEAIVATWRLITAIGRAGLAFGGLGAAALVKAVPGLGTLVANMKSSSKDADVMTGKIKGLVGQLELLALAASAGYGIGTLLNDYVINPLTEKLTGEKDQTLGGWLYEATHRDAQSAPSLVTAGASPLSRFMGNEKRPSLVNAGMNRQRLSGEMIMRFENAPPGFRVDAAKTNQPEFDFNPRVGFRTPFAGTGGF